MTEKITIGFIPLADASSLLAAVDFGFAESEGLAIELVREVSWANVREKLSAGLFDAAHMLAPMAVASALGVMPGEAFTAPYVLATNGNAITVSPALMEEIEAELAGEPALPLSTAKALARIAARRKRDGLPPLTFGSTFPFSCHTYLLRFWLAAGGLDTASELRLAVLPPPHMVESLARGEVDGFCVGSPWNSVAADLGSGCILHFGCEIVSNLTEKVLAARTSWASSHQDTMIKLMRAISAAAVFVRDPKNWFACCEQLSKPGRIGASPNLIERALSCVLKPGHGQAARSDARFLVLNSGAEGKPDAVQAAWLYSQMVRWKQVAAGRDQLEHAKAVLSPDLFDLAFGQGSSANVPSPYPPDGVGAFTGPAFHKDAVTAYLDGLPGG
jgi:ABC-type nitrate/sulfonate/bicarbonate transport system substrate-binding protein